MWQELNKLTEYCKFGATLDQMLQDRLVCGIPDECWQRRLLSEEELTFKSAFKIAQALETAECQIKDLQGSSRVHQLQKTQDHRTRVPEPHDQTTCYRCGGPHPSHTCRFKTEECNYCHKKRAYSKSLQSQKAAPARQTKARHKGNTQTH